MNAALNGTRRALRLGTGLATCVSCIVFAQSAFGQAIELPDISTPSALVSTAGNVMTVNADGANRVFEWNTFSVDAGGTVNFISRNNANVLDTTTALTVVNRVIGSPGAPGAPRTFTPSVIDGKLTSTPNIAVWLVNPSGIRFGATGAFNGASLALSTLDFPGLTIGSPSSDNTVDIQSRLTNNDVVDPTTVKIALDAGAGSLISSGSVLLLGEQIDVGKVVKAAGDVYIVAASDARITTRAGSPVNYAITKGTRYSGVNVLGTGNVQGRKIVIVASNGTDTLKTLLQVQEDGKLTATATGDGIVLLTQSNPLAMVTAAGAEIDSFGSLRTTGTGSDVKITSNARATVANTIAVKGSFFGHNTSNKQIAHCCGSCGCGRIRCSPMPGALPK